MATSKQVAQLAGVSRATVSRVLNGSTHISDEAKERVYAAMKALEYEPNAVAQSLARQRSHMIGLGLFQEKDGFSLSYLGRTENYYYTDILRSIEQTAVALGYDLFLPAHPHDKSSESYIRRLQAHSVAGTIMLALDPSDPRVPALLHAAIPTVFIDTRGQGSHATYVDSNHIAAGRQIAEHLLALGHRRIAFLTGPLTDMASTERLLGCQQALTQAGVMLDPGLLCLAGWNTEEAHQAARAFLNRRRDFTAIIAGSDMMAIGILRALHECGLRVPHDVSLTGFDDVVLSQYTTPSLTTVRTDREAMGRGAVQRLAALIDGDADRSPLIIPTHLVVRESTGPATT